MVCKGAIFDIDGILFDTERVFQETWKEIANEMHISLDEAFPEKISGTNGITMCQIIEKYYSVSDGNIIRNECMERVKEKLAKSLPVKEGMYEILQFFQKKGIRMAVASSSNIQQIHTNLKMADIQNYFDAIVSGEEVEHGKPAPDIFVCAAEKMDCRPEECFVFEDSANGVKAGYRAGCMTIMIPDLIEPSEEILPYCFMICRSFKDAEEKIDCFI